jgi:hypothetical protein
LCPLAHPFLHNPPHFFSPSNSIAGSNPTKISAYGSFSPLVT